MEGPDDGAVVGTKDLVGLTDGTPVGAVGTNEGADVGAVGKEDGRIDGSSEGSIEPLGWGVIVGDCDGGGESVGLGDRVGRNDKDGKCELDGAGLGIIEGRSVGATEGAVVEEGWLEAYSSCPSIDEVRVSALTVVILRPSPHTANIVAPIKARNTKEMKSTIFERLR